MAKDLGSAIRSLRRAPAFTGLVVLTLALGIGATTAMFSVVDAVLINPLPFPNADRLSEIFMLFSRDGSRELPPPEAIDRAVRNEEGVFASVEAYAFGRAILTGHGEPDDIMFAGISPGLPALLGVAPTLGRMFTQEDVANRDRIVLISERLWASRFGRDPLILSRTLILDDRSYAIVGVLPRKFMFPDFSADVWRPLDVSDRAKPPQFLVARRPGVSLSQADERLAAVSAGLRDQGTLGKGQQLDADVLFQMRSGRRGVNSLYVLLGAVSLVLLVACVNVTNLLLVRASARHGELALMNALGAGRAVLLRSAMVESLLLAATGGLLGVLVAKGLLQAILGLAPANLTFLARASTELDPRAVAFAIGITALTCVVSGVLPAWRTSGIDAVDVLKQRSSAMIGARDDWWQGALVAGQLALVIVLLTGAGLLLRSFDRLTSVDLGFEPRGLAVVYVQLTRYTAPDAALSFMRQVEARVESTLGVRVAIASATPVRVGGFDADAQPEAEGQASPSAVLALPISRVSPDYFQTLGVPIVEGRAFVPEDDAEAIIVNDVIARRYWGTTSPVGRRFRLGPKQPWQTVVGVARDIKTMGPSDAVGEGTEVYLPFVRGRQAPFLSLLIATKGNPEAELQQVKRMIWELDARIPILEATTMAEQVSESVARPRFLLTLTSAFAVAAVLLSAIGVYGVCAYWVSRRKRELAIRVALGASREQVMAMVLARVGRIAAAGCAVGLVLAVWGSQAIESLLFQTDARDPLTLISVTVTLGLLALLACALPARTASRVDPMSVLRAE